MGPVSFAHPCRPLQEAISQARGLDASSVGVGRKPPSLQPTSVSTGDACVPQKVQSWTPDVAQKG